MIKKLIEKYRRSARKQRASIFLSCFSINKSTIILDLGSEDGSAIHDVLKGRGYKPENIYCGYR